MKSSSSTSSILRLNDKNNQEGASSPRNVLRRSNSSSVTVLHQKQLPSYCAERFYILSELQLHSVSPTFLVENNNHHHAPTDDNTTAVTVELSLEGSSSQEAPSSSLLPLQPFSILYLVWKPDFDGVTCTNAVKAFGNESIVPAVHKVQGITRIRRPSLGQSSSSSSLSRCDSDDDSNHGEDTSEHGPPPNMDQHVDACTRLYLVVEQVCGNSGTAGRDDNRAHFEKLERYATELSRWVSTELRGLVQGISIGVANQERAAPGLEACMNALHVGSQDRRRYGNRSTEDGSKSSIGLIAESYADLVGPGDVHHDHSHHRQSASQPPPAVELQQCIVTAEWSAAGDLMTFAQRAHGVWRDQHQLPPLPRSTSRKKPVRRVQPRAVELTPQQQRADILYHCSVVSVLMLYFFFHYRQDVLELMAYFS